MVEFVVTHLLIKCEWLFRRNLVGARAWSIPTHIIVIFLKYIHTFCKHTYFFSSLRYSLSHSLCLYFIRSRPICGGSVRNVFLFQLNLHRHLSTQHFAMSLFCLPSLVWYTNLSQYSWLHFSSILWFICSVFRLQSTHNSTAPFVFSENEFNLC